MGVERRLGLGLAALGRPGYITLGRAHDLADRSIGGMREQTHLMLDTAWELGIRFIDAARGYGLAETFLGEWLEAHPGRRDELTIESKWGYTYTADWQIDALEHEHKQHSLAQFERQWEETLEAIGEPDIYLVHSLTPDSPALGDAALLERLEALADTGVLVGASVTGTSQSETIRAMLQYPWMRAVQATWNLLEPSAGEALKAASDAGMLVSAKEVLANGRLVPPMPAGTVGVTPDAAAVAAVLAQPWCDIALTGAVTPEQLHANLLAADVEGIAVVDAAHEMVQEPEDYWSARSALDWN